MQNINRKVCVITGTRAEYGLLYWTMKGIDSDDNLQLQTIATGMHLSPEFGLTYKEIEKDGFEINKKIEILLSGDTPVSISKSIGLGVISFSEAFEELKPDIVLLLGDRFEILSAALAAMIARIPIAHCHGGEATQGLIDEPIRHSISKMSHIHFTSTEAYRQRVIQMGEQPHTVFNVGALGIENINKLNLLDLKSFEKSIDFDLEDMRFFLVTFHPVTLENNSSESQFKELLTALSAYPDVKIIFTKANSDTDGRVINQLIDEAVKNHPDRYIAFQSLGQLRYLSALRFTALVIGNSSSGLIEAPSFNVPTINIGDRQKGRIIGETIINCLPVSDDIMNAINKGLSDAFTSQISEATNPYGTGNVSDEIVQTLKKIELDELVKKDFYNIKFDSK